MANLNPELESRGWIARAYSTRRYSILFYSLLATLAAGPLFDALGFDANLLEVFLAVNLLAAVLPSASENKGWVLLGLFLVAVLARYGAGSINQPAISTAGLALWTVVALLASARAVRFAARATSVDSEHLYAALDAYLLSGIFLGVLYWTLEQLSPGSFEVAPHRGTEDFSIASAIYFSFVTLATLGYGDVLPRSETARGIAIVEAVAGQLFLAVMIARLVSIYARASMESDRG
jgi:hypothetical protein